MRFKTFEGNASDFQTGELDRKLRMIGEHDTRLWTLLKHC